MLERNAVIWTRCMIFIFYCSVFKVFVVKSKLMHYAWNFLNHFLVNGEINWITYDTEHFHKRFFETKYLRWYLLGKYKNISIVFIRRKFECGQCLVSVPHYLWNFLMIYSSSKNLETLIIKCALLLIIMLFCCQERYHIIGIQHILTKYFT